MFRKLFAVSVLAMMLVVTGCKSTQEKNADKYVELLNGSGEHWEVIKGESNAGGWSVIRNVNTGEYVAVNVSKFDRQTMTTLDQFVAALGANDVEHNLTPVSHSQYHDPYYTDESYTDANGQTHYYREYHEGYWEYWTNYASRSGYEFENRRANAKDLESLAANAAKLDANAARVALVTEYGFSQERAAKVAALSKQMRDIAGTRELTANDKSVFTQEVLGVDYASLAKSMDKAAKGDAQSFDRMLQQAAGTNGISPEQARALILDLSGQAE